MSTEICPKIAKCPIFQETSFEGYDLTETLQEIYKNAYCLASQEKFKTCKRYIASETLKMPIPKVIMPNSTRTVQEIKEMIEKSKN